MWNGNANLITVWYSYCLKGTWSLRTAVVHSKILSWPEPQGQRRIYIMAQMKAITMDSFYRISYPEGIFVIHYRGPAIWGFKKENRERETNSHGTSLIFLSKIRLYLSVENYFWSNPFRTMWKYKWENTPTNVQMQNRIIYFG